MVFRLYYQFQHITLFIRLFWICIWKTAWRLLGLTIMAISFIFPKPELIFDANHMAVGVKDRENKLVIHADKIPAFNRTYWANWFGQKDSMVLPLENNIF